MPLDGNDRQEIADLIRTSLEGLRGQTPAEGGEGGSSPLTGSPQLEVRFAGRSIDVESLISLGRVGRAIDPIANAACCNGCD
jgi:hypothetical protein